MHGVRRGPRLQGAAAAEAQKREREAADLCRRALQLRNKQRDIHYFSEENIALVARALELNGEEYSLWNYRREMMIAMREKRRMRTDGTLEKNGKLEKDRNETNTLEKRWLAELELTRRALRWMPKAYGTWAYRLFLLGFHGIDENVRRKVVKEEQAMVQTLLKQDPRNFHGWAHRMRIKQLEGNASTLGSREELERELKYVEGKINDDFANYSAWHVRSRILPRKHEHKTEVLDREFAFVREAFYTEPEVQSTWFYHRWLLAGAPQQGREGKRRVELWESELDMCNALLEIEPDARFALQAKAFLLTKLHRLVDARNIYSQLAKLVG